MTRIALLAAVTLALTACQAKPEPYKTLISGTVETTTVAFQSSDGHLKMGGQDIRVTFVDAANKPVTVTSPTLTMSLAPGSGSPGAQVPVTLTEGEKGLYGGKPDLGIQGNWQAKVTWTQDGKPLSWGFGTMVL
ncbi:MAG: FixH family protein [Candidatus Sericytochromatia bacterium]|nr:FixH family protein [Candidatus Sericytochromatia bacterium]